MKRPLILLSCVLLAGCGTSTYGSKPGINSPDVDTPAVVSTLPAGSCHARHVIVEDPQAWEPDPKCTSGATDGGLSMAQLCPVAHTRPIRPPVSYTEALKKAQMKAYGYAGSPALFEEDHLISLELGGSPRNPQNLWPEQHASPNKKDSVENAAHSAVCSGKLSLADAQRKIATDWVGLGKELGALKP